MNVDDKILSISKKVADKTSLTQLNTFNDEMTISQVVRFFEKNNVTFTKTMIQNYVRVGVLPPPLEKRYYTRKHLILLSLIDSLKKIYSLDEIKNIFAPILRDTDTFDDDMIDVTDVYAQYCQLYDKALKYWENKLPEILKDIDLFTENLKFDNNDKNIAKTFMTMLTLMAQSIATKHIVNSILEETK